MDPSVYIPAYLERIYLASHPELTDAARELVHNDMSANPQKYAQSEHAQALLSYAGVHRHLLDELHRIEDMGSDEEFEQTRNRLFDDMRDELLKIVRVDALGGRCPAARHHFGGHTRRRLPGRPDEARSDHDRLPAAKRARVRHGGPTLLGQ